MYSRSLLRLFVLPMLMSFSAIAQSEHGRHHDLPKPVEVTSDNCFNPGDPNQFRLWPGRAPGSLGDDPCKDIPFVQMVSDAARGERQPAVLIIPGGGYDNLKNSREQGPVASYFSRHLHVAAFVLYYRLAQKDGTYRYPTPMWDGQRAIKFIRAHAGQLEVDPERVAVFGFSAGGHLASTLTLHSASDFDLPAHDEVDRQSGKPTLLGLGYPVISMDPADVPPTGSYKNLLRGYDGEQLQHLQTYLSGEKNVRRDTVPVFLFESMDDKVVSPQNSLLLVQALHSAGIPLDLHMFQHGEHGAGLAEMLSEERAWPEMFHHWLVVQHFIAK